MLGTIIGDIVGSVYEWHNIKTKGFPLFRDDCFFTDDTVITTTTADALMKGGKSATSSTPTKNGDGFIRTQAMASGLAVGCIPTTVSHIIRGATVPR